MPRRPEPWYREQVGEYYVTIRGKQHRLGPDKDKAYDKFHELMTKQQGVIVTGSVAEVIERFMDWVQVNRPKSYTWYKKRIDRFYKDIKDLGTNEIKPLHIREILDAAKWSDAYKAGCVTAMKRVFNFAVEHGYMDRNPLRGLKKPDPGRREQLISQQEFDQSLGHVPNQNFKDVVRFIWYTGCRPEEAVKIEPKMVDLKLSRILIPRKQAKKKKRPRVIYLCPEAREIVERNMSNSPLFLNTKGRAWTAYAIACTWGRIAKKTGKRFCSYALRHSYITDQLMAGTDAVTLASLVGHEDTSMIAKVYAHVTHDPAYMLKHAARKSASTEKPDGDEGAD
jgi:integrase